MKFELIWEAAYFTFVLWTCFELEIGSHHFPGIAANILDSFFFSQGGGWSQNVIAWHPVIDGPLQCQPDVLKTTAFRLINDCTNGYIKLLETNIPIYSDLQSDSNGCSACLSVSPLASFCTCSALSGYLDHCSHVITIGQVGVFIFHLLAFTITSNNPKALQNWCLVAHALWMSHWLLFCID